MRILIICAAGGAIQLEAAAGALQAIDDVCDIRAATVEYRACSGGAPVAALHAAGVSGRDICGIIRNTPMERLLSRPLNSRYYDAGGVYKLLSEHLPETPLTNCRVAVTREKDMCSCMVDATPITTLASMSIQGVMRPQLIGTDYYGDGGVKNMIPTCKINAIADYQHIFMLLAPFADTGKSTSCFPFDTELRALAGILDRETVQIYEDGWGELANVTLIQPTIPAEAQGRGLLADLLSWTPDNIMLEHACRFAAEAMRKKF